MDLVRSSLRVARDVVGRGRDRLAERAVRAELARRSDPDAGPHPCAVWFSHSTAQLYQLQQWVAPLEHLARRRPVLLMVQRADVARALARSTTLPVHLARRSADVDALLAEQQVELVFYVNNATANFTVLRATGQRHVHLSHGESDKVSMVSHQLRAYDYCFVAGRASAERIRSEVWGIDPSRLLPVGRPQLDHVPALRPRADGRRTVLYAPTWEGDGPQMGYGSMASHGVALVRSLLAADGLRLVVRPHPLTGTRSRAHRVALSEVEQLVAAAGPERGHRVDRSGAADAALAAAEVGICDVSAMAMDCLGLGRPLLLTEPAASGAWLAPHGLATWVPTLSAADSTDAAARVRELLARGPAPDQRERVDELFGDTTAGAQTRRFEDAVETVLATIP